MSGCIEYMMAHPEIVEQLPKEGLEMLLALVRAEKMRLSGCMPQSATDSLVACVDDKMMRDIVNDLRKVPEPGGFLPAQGGPPMEKRSAWPKLTPLSSPPGVKICDQMMDVQDALDKRDLERRLK